MYYLFAIDASIAVLPSITQTLYPFNRVDEEAHEMIAFNLQHQTYSGISNSLKTPQVVLCLEAAIKR